MAACSIVGAGAVAVKSIPGKCVTVGVPAKVVRAMSFDMVLRKRLLVRRSDPKAQTDDHIVLNGKCAARPNGPVLTETHKS